MYNMCAAATYCKASNHGNVRLIALLAVVTVLWEEQQLLNAAGSSYRPAYGLYLKTVMPVLWRDPI